MEYAVFGMRYVTMLLRSIFHSQIMNDTLFIMGLIEMISPS